MRVKNCSLKKMLQFATETHFHGVKELYSAPKLFKVLWIVIIIGSTGLCLYETYKVLLEYIESEPVTQISTNPPDHFPPALFCPFDWINESAVENLGISEKMLMFGLGRLTSFSVLYDQSHELLQSAAANITETEMEFNTLLKTKFDNDIEVSASLLE